MQGRIIAVTGATAGYGERMARDFARKGARLILIGRRQDRLDKLAQEIGEDSAFKICCDVRDAAAYAELLKALPSSFSDVDILINNAGVGLGRDLSQEADLNDWLGMVQTNIIGLLAGTHALLPGMVERNRGHIVNIGSIAAGFPTPRNAIYAACKAFVRQFSFCLRADLLGTMVRVTDVEPGQGGGTEFTVVRSRGDEEHARGLYGANRLIEPDDVAETVEWVVSRPAHVNVNLVQIMSIDQAFGPSAFAS